MPAPDTTSNRQWTLQALAWFAGLTLWRSWSTWTKGGERLLGGATGDDLVGTQWVWWWTCHALTGGHDLMAAEHAFHPYGIWPLAQFNLLDAFLALPLMATVGPHWGYSGTVAGMLVATGLSVFWLCRAEGAHPVAALLAGTFVLTSEFVFIEVTTGRISQAFLAPLVVGLGLWRLLARSGGWGRAVWTGLASAACLLTYWYYGLFLAFGALILVLAAPAEGRSLRQRAGPVLLAGALTLALTLPFVTALLSEVATLPGIEQSADAPDHGAAARGSAGLAWAMDFSHALRWPVWPRGEGAHAGMLPGGLAWTWLGLSLALLVSFRERRGVWVGVALVGAVLALGPYPRIDDDTWLTTVTLPFLWLVDHLPFFERLWWPYRAASLTLVALAVLAARNATDLAGELPPRARTPALLGLLALGMAELGASGRLEAFNSAQVAQAPPAYRHIDGPVVTLPLESAYGAPAVALPMQIQHEQPTLYGLGGHIDGHRPAAIEALLADNALLRALVEDLPLPEPIDPADLRGLRDLGYRWVVLDRRGYGVQPERGLRALDRTQDALGPPLQDDGVAAVWRLPSP